MCEVITESTAPLGEDGLSPIFQLLRPSYQVMYHTLHSTTHDHFCFFTIKVLKPLSIIQGMSFYIIDVNGKRVGILSVEQRKNDVQAVCDGSAGQNSSAIGH